MKSLEKTSNELYKCFQDGSFVVKTSKETLNCLAPDLALEHVNINSTEDLVVLSASRKMKMPERDGVL